MLGIFVTKFTVMLNAFMSAECVGSVLCWYFCCNIHKYTEALHDFENGALNMYLFEFSCHKGYNYEKGLHDLKNDALDQHLLGFLSQSSHDVEC